MKTIINYLLSIILAILIIILFFVILFSNTVLNEEYILAKIEEQDYYNKVYEKAKDNFENYIHQSGFEETVLEDIITKDKIKADTKIIIDNIYKGKNEKINTDEIKNNLNKNIEKIIGNDVTKTQKQAIDGFTEHICNEYKSTISYFNIESNIGKYIVKITNMVHLVKIILLFCIGIDFILLFVLNLKRIYNFILQIGISITTSGFFLLFIRLFIDAKININAITILNDLVSEILRNVLNEIIGLVLKYGILMLASGTLFIVLSGYLKNKSKEKIS